MKRNELASELAAQVAIQVGEYLKKEEIVSGQEEVKEEECVGHHAIVTKHDVFAQELIIEELSSHFPSSKFITEEKSKHSAIITEENYPIHKEELIFCIDPVDGTSQMNNGLYEYSVSIGVISHGRHIGGVIFAPEIRGGLIVFTEENSNAVYRERWYGPYKPARVVEREIKKSVIYIGPDIFLLKDFQSMMLEASQQVRTTNCTGSCALGLALLATGKIDALIQPVQCPWDWAAGYPLVEKAGGKFIFYHYRNGAIVRMEKPDNLSYSPKNRNTAFIAGTPHMAEWLFGLVVKHWGP